MKLTQYLLPDGRTREVTIDRDGEVELMASAVESHGWRFECEILRTGQVSVTAFDPVDEVNVAIEVVPNGPVVAEATDRVVKEAYRLAKEGHE